MAQYPIEVSVYDELPKHKVVSLRGSGVKEVNCGGYDDNFVSTKVISTYPLLPTGERDGDPIADQLYVRRGDNWALLAVADGCGWGKRPQRAAQDAVTAFAQYLNKQQAYIRDLQDAGHYMLRAFSEAHHKIVEGKDDIWEAGTTTLLGLLILKLDKITPDAGIHKWGLLCGSVGDCKAFHVDVKKHEVFDINAGTVRALTEPGGRLGPRDGFGYPDLRNMHLYFSIADEGDIVLLVSDGVYDNLDPHTLGKLPADLNLPYKAWEEMSITEIKNTKTNYMKNLLEKIIFSSNETVSPSSITSSIISYCWGVTSKGREFMENNPSKKQPTDIIAFPGKMDHTTCVAFAVNETPIRGGKI